MTHERRRSVQHVLRVLNPAVGSEGAHVHADDPFRLHTVRGEEFDEHDGVEQASAATGEGEHAQERVDTHEVAGQRMVRCTCSRVMLSLIASRQASRPASENGCMK